MKLLDNKVYREVVDLGSQLLDAQRNQTALLETANDKLSDAATASKVAGDLLRQSITAGDPDLASHFANQTQKTDTAGKRLQKKLDKQLKAADHITEELYSKYNAAMERYCKQRVLIDVLLVAIFAISVTCLTLFVGKSFIAINADYFGLTAQIFPLLFIALYIEKPKKERATDGVWTRLYKVSNGLSACLLGTAVSLAVVATGHGRFAGFWITIYCFLCMLPEIYGAIMRRQTIS